MEFSRQEYWMEWVAISFFRGSFQPRDQTWVSCIEGGFFTLWAAREAQNNKGCNLMSKNLSPDPGSNLSQNINLSKGKILIVLEEKTHIQTDGLIPSITGKVFPLRILIQLVMKSIKALNFKRLFPFKSYTQRKMWWWSCHYQNSSEVPGLYEPFGKYQAILRYNSAKHSQFSTSPKDRPGTNSFAACFVLPSLGWQAI